MRAFVRFVTPGGETVELGHGDLIGRLWSAALCIDEPRISEAHALVSHRGDSLVLLALRGRFAIGKDPLTKLVLTPGQQIELAPGISLQVQHVAIPDSVLGIEGDGLPRQILPGVCSLVTRPRPSLLARWSGDASAVLWSSGAGWRLRVGEESAVPVLPGDEWTLDGRTFRAVAISLDTAQGGATLGSGGIDRPLRIIGNYDSAQIEVEAEVVALGGISARLISELVAFDGPVAWDVLAGEIWPDEDDKKSLRGKFDVALVRLRKRLRDHRIRPNLVHATGAGHFHLLLHPRDEVVDRT